MASGTLCPNCGKPVMPYGRFLRQAEPLKISRCTNCDVELKRKKSVWILLIAGAIVLATMIGLGIPFTFERWGVIAASVFTFVVSVAAVVILNLSGWLFVGWDLVAPSDRDEGQPGP